MLRSASSGTMRVQARLNAGRAITECWMAKIPSSSVSIESVLTRSPAAPESIVFGTKTAFHETDGVKKRRQEEYIDAGAIQRREKCSHGFHLAVKGGPAGRLGASGQLLAVSGSMICGTSVIRVTGMPLSSACLWMAASSFAK